MEIFLPTQVYIYIYMEVNNGNESDNISKKQNKTKNEVMQREEFNVKESRRYNVSVLMNHHQDWKGWCWVTLNYRWIFNLTSPDTILPGPNDDSLEPKRYNVDFLLHWILLFGLSCFSISLSLSLYIYIYRGIDIVLMKLPWLENSAKTYMRHTEHLTAVSTLLGFISSAYSDLHH